MNKTIIAVGAVLVLGITAYFLFSSKSDDAMVVSEENEVTETSSADNEAFSEIDLNGTGPLSVFMESGRSVRCEFESVDESGTSNGVFKYSDQQYRVEAETQTEGGVYQSNIISDGQYIYVWGNGPEGEMAIMMSEKETQANESADAFVESGETFDPEQSVSYECSTWSADAAEFVPPSDVEFMDMDAMMQQMMGQMPEGFTLPQ